MFIIDDVTQKVIKKYPHRCIDIAQSFDEKQVRSKAWLTHYLEQVLAKKLKDSLIDRVIIVGGWYGHMLISAVRELLGDITILFYEIDEEAIDICKHHYFPDDKNIKYKHQDATEVEFSGNKKLIICTSCEHMKPLNVKSGIVLLQSNNYASIEEHTNCVNSVDDFKSQYNFKKMFYEGELRFMNYTRYMIIGRI